MSISFEIPQDIEQQLRTEGADLSHKAREAFLVELYREDRISHSQLREALGLSFHEAEQLIKERGAGHDISRDEFESGQRMTPRDLTHEEAAEAAVGDGSREAVRLERAHVPSRTFTFGPESEEQLLEETLLAWQSQGPTAAWQAMFDMLAWWFEARGLDPETQRVDRTHNEVHRVPWGRALAEHGDDA